ncbi:glutamyl-tRNA reductase [Acidianus sulfidivorans JP7]|uniref:Glutamyl-tRNA reductase n=1 Tax=Acidianus sulfidivorans JP7 TaxID=619593 RepID=A0A2U9IMV9_9CREN|nr:glutamyl-tRNA reductase [Acidianus sulfidivorans]AWR97346.1 glutamyl-tRNA reductase [Acidianus sulfidivorans JP7]
MSITDEINEKYYAILYTYKTVGFSNLSSHYLRDSEIKLLHNLVSTEMIILQTCNRVELYLYADDYGKVEELLHFLDNVHKKEISKDATILKGYDAIKHLFKVASGLDSLSIGEYEILGQVKLALNNARKLGISGKYIDALFERAIKIGRKVRKETNISKGKVGLYSLAIDLVKSKTDISKAKILVIGAGEIGSKIVSMLKSVNAKNVTIMNRTVEKAKELSEKYGYEFTEFNLSKIKDYDIIFSAIFYPSKITINDKLVVDLSYPSVFEGNNIYKLEDLQFISTQVAEKRSKEIIEAEKIIEESMGDFISDYEEIIYNQIVSQIMNTIEEIRKAEVERANKEIRKNNEDVDEILDAMSKSMIKKIFSPMLLKIKDYIKTDEKNYINFILELFNYGKLPDNETKEIKKEQINKRSSS